MANIKNVSKTQEKHISTSSHNISVIYWPNILIFGEKHSHNHDEIRLKIRNKRLSILPKIPNGFFSTGKVSFISSWSHQPSVTFQSSCVLFYVT